MSNLTSSLYSFARNTLLACREFSTNKELASLFNTGDLSPFKLGIVEADDRITRVDLFLDYILTQDHATKGPVFPLFLDFLRRRYQYDNALRSELDDLYQAVLLELDLQPPILSEQPESETRSTTGFPLEKKAPFDKNLLLRKKYALIAIFLGLAVFLISLLLFPEWRSDWRMLLVLGVMIFIGIVAFIANFRQAFE